MDGECHMNNTHPLESTVSVNVKEEYVDFGDGKDSDSDAAITKDNVELQDHLIRDVKNIKAEFSSSGVHDMTHGNLKIEEINVDVTKTEFNKGLLYCEDCQVYCEDYCSKCGMLVHILNSAVSFNADNISPEELPNDDILEIRDYFGEFHIFAIKSIPAGVTFGPFTGLSRTERSWKIKGGKFVVNNDTSKYLNWMQYINPARNISEQNLLVFQYEDNLYYQSTCQIQEDDELLVHFGEEYEDSLNRNIEMDFIPTTEYIFKDAFACTFCCLGFNSKSHLAKHKTVCLANIAGGFSIEEVMQCPSCKIHLDRKEYIVNHMTYCSDRNDKKWILPTSGTKRKIQPYLTHKCQQCKYRTKYKADLKNHTNRHYEVKLYKCGTCCRRFKTKQVLRLHAENAHMRAGGEEDSERSTRVYIIDTQIKAEHSRLRDEVGQFKCLLCAFRTKYKHNLKSHMKAKHLKEFKYKCDTCDYKTNRKSELKTHVESRHLKVFKYKCDICDYKTNQKPPLEEHIKARHLKEFKYKCDACDYKTNQRTTLQTHVQTRHLKVFKHKCDTCEYKTNRKPELKRHVESRHLKIFKYKCDRCDYETNIKSTLQTHIETRHLKEFKYKCDLCDYKANQEFQLRSHIETKHLNVFKYKCDKCDYKTNKISDLKIHTETRHLKVFKHKCDSCDYKTNQKSNLKTHVDTRHLKVFKYKCDACDYKTNRKVEFEAHVESRHLNESKYKCDVCDYKASKEFHLKNHIETKHLKVFKYKCDACDYKSNRKSSFVLHIETKHMNVFKYKCDTCDYKTNVTSNLKAHIKARHSK